MNLFGWMMSAGVVAAATGAMAQPVPPDAGGPPAVAEVSDLDGPYAAMPPPPPRHRRFVPEARLPAAAAPAVLSPNEVTRVARDEGFAPLGYPRQRGLVYTMAVINPNGDDGRLVIDARSGRLVRFMPAWQMGDRMEQATEASYGRIQGLPPMVERHPPRPPRAIPHYASRGTATPMPRPAPQHPVGDRAAKAASGTAAAAKDATKPALDQARQDGTKPETAKQETAAVQGKPAAAPSAAGPAPAEAKPSSEIRPTEPMPPVQGLE